VNHRQFIRSLCAILAGALLTPAVSFAITNAPAASRHVIIISLDGFRPEFYLPGDASSACPTLTGMRNAGSCAKGAIAAYPSMTYPGHATIATGVSPARHGVNANTIFEPPATEGRGYFFASDIQVPALWDVAHKAGLTVGSVSWPCTAGSKSIDFDFPEFFTTKVGKEFDLTFKHATPGLFDKLGATRDSMTTIRTNGAAWDAFLANCAIKLIEIERPNLLFVHLLESDKEQHKNGRNAPELPAVMRRLDGLVRDIIEATKKAGIYERTTFIVLGDHGFANVSQSIRPNVLLARKGFITLEDKRVTDWKAMVQNTGGSAGVYVKNPKDTGTVAEVRALLEANASVDGKRLFTIIDKEQLVKLGGPRDAAFYLEAEPSYMFSGSLSGDELVTKAPLKGNHGFLPTKTELYTGFIVAGPGVKKGVTLDTIRLADVAPTVAQLLGTEMKNTDGRALTEILAP
jgi:predicted AlkP superfamily pyrophosphatase or phosphodiesterase